MKLLSIQIEQKAKVQHQSILSFHVLKFQLRTDSNGLWIHNPGLQLQDKPEILLNKLEFEKSQALAYNVIVWVHIVTTSMIIPALIEVR